MTRIRIFFLFFIAVLLQAGAYGLTFVLPRLFEGFGANEKVVGAMLSITTVATIVTVYYSGHLSDKFGRVATLSMGSFFISLALILYYLSTSVGLTLVLASILLGMGWALTYSLAPVVLTRLVAGDERIRYFSLLSVFVMAGFGLSPVLASVIENNGYPINYAFLITGLLCLASSLIFWSLINPIRHHARNAAPESASRLTLETMRGALASRAVLPVIMVFLGASVFAGMNNFQTVIADERNLDYANYFLAYTITVIVFRVVLARFKGGRSPYLIIALLQFVMCASILLLYGSGNSTSLYYLVAFLFGIGYGVSYPILVAMAANDADKQLVPQTLQLFALMYFIGIFGFPLIAGWLIVDIGTPALLLVVAVIAAIEASLALKRAIENRIAAIKMALKEKS